MPKSLLTASRAQPLMRAGSPAGTLCCRPLPTRCQRATLCAATRQTTTSTVAVSLKAAELHPVTQGQVLLQELEGAGVYAVYNQEEQLQYVGLSKKIGASIAHHWQDLPGATASVKFHEVSDATKENLVKAWKAWVEEAVQLTGNIPPGNSPGDTRWQAQRTSPFRPELRLIAGKGSINVAPEQLVDHLVHGNKIVAFIKGTRTEPQSSSSHKLLKILNEAKADYDVVNVLDNTHNPGLRDAIKQHSHTPAIPQLYINGKFVGGTDVCAQMASTGELQQLLDNA